MNLNDLMKGNALGGVTQLAAANPQLLAAITSLLSSKDSSVGGAGGLGAIVRAFQGGGLGDAVASWIGNGPNQPVSPDQVSSVLGADTLSQFAAKAGIGQSEASAVLAGLLPDVVNHLTPQGQLPDADGADTALSGLLGLLRR